MITKQIVVTEEYIRRGQRSNCRACPIALAVAEHFPGLFAFAGPNYISISTRKHGSFDLFTDENVIHLAKTPFNANIFMSLFDNGELMKPISLNLMFSETQEEKEKLYVD